MGVLECEILWCFFSVVEACLCIADRVLWVWIFLVRKKLGLLECLGLARQRCPDDRAVIVVVVGKGGG